MTVSRGFFLKWRMFPTKFEEKKNQNAHFMLNNFFSVNGAVYDTL
jgi:hypothetical protein